ncbi:hypothetical protein FRUB_04857 [Fimbriiglobus ruber]|uniref:Uncharacterized protein n=2 Tax=Fimbriiglobus ruber TaxID=1908690 RepID=A0A225DXA7_9BACT|nr:hypothetical protein FRUB_04857 [Fimbriiglobus ruber]
MANDGRFPCDLAVFADTGEEPAAVYRHLDWLRSLGTPPILIRSAGRLGDDLIRGCGPTRRFVSIPAFTLGEAGRVGRIPRQCTRTYKIDVVERAIRRDLLGLAPGRRCPPGVRVVQYFGISTDEAGRAARARKRFAEKQWTVPAYPLLDLGWTRRDCLTWLADRVPHPVPRSACVFCPFHDNAAWRDLRTVDPDGWARAVAIDEALRADGSACRRGFRQPLYLHRSCQPLAEIAFDALAPEPLDPMAGECHGMCGV